MQFLVLAVVFVSTLMLMMGAYAFFNRRSLADAEAARERLKTVEDVLSTRTTKSILKDESFSEVEFLNRLLTGRQITEEVARRLRLAGSNMKVGAFILVVLVSGAAGMMLAIRVNPLFGPPIGTVLGVMVPVFWIVRAQRKRLAAFESQLPDSIDMLVGAMRAGYSFQAAMKFVGDEVGPPLGPEFLRFYDEQRLGVEVRVALLALQDRLESTDLKMFVTAVLIQRETGGSLGEVLQNIGDLMRQRVAMRGQLETLTAEARLSARLLAVLPVVVFIALSAMSPEFMAPLLVSPIGQALLLGSAVSVMFGYVAMKKIADIDY
ncbi:MAG: type II secretion system F family protein [Gemmatimonadaceae bacterium]